MRFSQKFIVLGGILVIIALIYSLAFDIYLFGDDFDYLNDVYEGWRKPLDLFERSGFFFRPVLNFSFLITYRLFGAYAPAYIARMVLVHLVSVSCLYFLLLTLTGNVWLAGMTALLWGTSPLHCEATIWGGGHSDSLVTLFLLLIFLYCARQKERMGQFRQQVILACLTLGAFGSKENWLILPVLFYGFCMVVLQIPLVKTIKLSLIPCLLAAVYLLIFMILPHFSPNLSFVEYANAPTLTSMVQKFFYLCYQYLGLGDRFYGHLWQDLLMLVLLIGIVVFLIRGHNRVGLWGLFWLLAALAMTLPVRYAPSRYNYLPLVGFWIMAMAVLVQSFRWVLARVSVSPLVRVSVVTIGVGYLCAYYTIMLYWEFSDYRRVGEANKAVVDMYRAIQDRIVPPQPILLVNTATRRPLTDIENSLRGYLKLLYRRPEALWELILFAPLANFAGDPFMLCMTPIPDNELPSVFQADVQILEFTDQGFRLEEQYATALREFYVKNQALPPRVQAYRLIPIANVE